MDLRSLDAEALRAILDDGPVAASGSTAAVAAVFRTGHAGTEALFIQRATKTSDPWSGHMAFPGGRTDATDQTPHHTAERETAEEVGLRLDPTSRLGALSDLQPGRQLDAVHVAAYWLDGPEPALTPNYEVAATLWVPLTTLANESRHIEHYYGPTDSSWPGIQLDEPTQVVWGLTLRMLGDLFARLACPFIELAPPNSA